MGIVVGFTLSQFSEIFRVRDAAGNPYVLIGGQAVNYWAERYLSTEPLLEKLQPFTSEDIDLKGGAQDVRHIAQQLNLAPIFPPKVSITALAGIIPFRIGDLRSNIEVVRRIPGVSGSVDELAIRAEWNGKSIRVLDPISLLACKLELAATVPQGTRRDVVHLRILKPCVRAFLGELLNHVEHGDIPARHWLAAASQALKLTSRRRAVQIGSKHQIDWQGILPLEAIAACPNKQIRRFHEHQVKFPDRSSKASPQ